MATEPEITTLSPDEFDKDPFSSARHTGAHYSGLFAVR